MNLFDLTGRVAIVTGGNGGIGLGMAKGLAGAGAKILVVGRNAEKNKDAVAELRQLGSEAQSHEADLTKEADCHAMVQAAVDAFGGADILVNNAGTNVRKRPEEYSLAEWHHVIDTNLTSAFVASQAVHPVMKKAGGGKIINIGSMMSIFGASFTAPYAATKGGIVQMTKAMACAWAVENIQVNAVLPGWIDTALTRRARQDIQGLHDGIQKRTPAGRWGVPDDFGGIAVFLAAPASDFLTGTAIPVDGGYSVQGAV